MTRTLLLAATLGLTLASGASAMNGVPYMPSLWPAEGAFAPKRSMADTVTRAQTDAPTAPVTEPAGRDR